MVHKAIEGNQKWCIPYFIKDFNEKSNVNGKVEVSKFTQVKDLYNLIEDAQQLNVKSFVLYLYIEPDQQIDLSELKDKTIYDVCMECSIDLELNELESKHCLVVAKRNNLIMKYEAESGGSMCVPSIFNHHIPTWNENNVNMKPIKPEARYVGLVNQAMTCYLNSLLQALYMTPEFRNALYKWEYIEGSETDETKSIPYQLQKLFLNLQTSTKSAVETTALTKSFGWNSNEAWQQHDIQELCRVMFDALELKFKNTEQADLINSLYEGKMIDYVKCLECGTEKTREDTFLDIPLPVKPFNSNTAYNSVEEAMKAFVQYETLEGANQYHCEKCNKKCDAHKGLKFTKFPYLLTLHLKRFDFDHQSFHRIKLNDKVTFQDILDLNSFVSPTTNQESPASEEDIGISAKCDDSSTTDSGTLEDDCAPCENNVLTNTNVLPNHDADDDEGIDMSNGPSTSSCNRHNHENEKHQDHCMMAKGPYIYELFSIMIHSGSASGGHYYAYIKDFRTQEWWCFNDQSVTQITHDDIQKTYGGGPTRAYYSGAYSSSTNAYMLMYRQIDASRNALPMQAEDFPQHIQELLKKIKESEDNDRRNREKQVARLKLAVYCYHPTTGNLFHTLLCASPEWTLAEATEEVWKKLKLKEVVSLEQCRLVSYERRSDLIDRSYEGREDEMISKIWCNQSHIELLLETRREDQKFEEYLPRGIMTKVYVIDVPRKELVEGPINVRGLLSQKVKEYKQLLGRNINMDPKQMKLMLRKYKIETRYIDDDEMDLQSAGFTDANKVFVSKMLDIDSNKPSHETMLCKFVEEFENVISLQVQIPDTDKEKLEELHIPSLSDKYEEKEKPYSNGPSKISIGDVYREIGSKYNDTLKSTRIMEDIPVRNISPQLGESEDWNTEQSNSEDSSLSDSDKTLVGDVQEDDDFPLSYHPPPTDNRRFEISNPLDIQGCDVDDESEYYFKATPCTKKLLTVLVDKRMHLGTLKKDLEPYVGVPMEYFKVFRQSSDTELECTDRLSTYVDGEKLKLKLERALRSGEFEVKLYQLQIDSITEPYKFLCETIVSKDMTFGQAKKQILSEMKKKYNIDIPYERCRLRQKSYKMVCKVFLDRQRFEDLRLCSPFEMVVQELPDKETVTNNNQVVLFVRRWSPSKLHLSQLQEVVLDDRSIDELRKKLSSMSNIPEEYIDIAKGKSIFPCDISVLKVQNDHQWINSLNSNDSSLYSDLDDGVVFLYRDNREMPKNLSPDERKEIITREMSRLMPSPSSNYRCPRREKELKIHVEIK